MAVIIVLIVLLIVMVGILLLVSFIHEQAIRELRDTAGTPVEPPTCCMPVDDDLWSSP